MCVRPTSRITETRGGGGGTEGPEQQVQGRWELRPEGSWKFAPGRTQSWGPHVWESKGLGRLRMGRTQLPCRHRGPRQWLRRCVRRPQASEGAPQASLLPPPPPPLPRSTHTRRACSCRMRPRTTLASSSEWPHACAGTCTQEQGSPQSTCSERWHCRSSSESRQPGRPSRPLPRESGQAVVRGGDGHEQGHTETRQDTESQSQDT